MTAFVLCQRPVTYKVRGGDPIAPVLFGGHFIFFKRLYSRFYMNFPFVGCPLICPLNMVQLHDSLDLGMSRSPKEEDSTPNQDPKPKSKAITMRRTAPIRMRNANAISATFPYRTSGASTSKRKRTRTAATTTLSKRKPDNTASNAQCSVRIGDIVGLTQPDGITQRFAKVSELCPFHNDQFAVVCVWLYTREEIAQDLTQHENGLTNTSSDETPWQHLKERWSLKQDRYDGDEYMLSTKRTIALWDATIIKCAPDAVATNICQNFIYNTDASERRICDVNDPVWRWMKKILTLRPAGHTLPNLRS